MHYMYLYAEFTDKTSNYFKLETCRKMVKVVRQKHKQL